MTSDNHASWTRQRKLKFLQETSPPEFHKKKLLNELVEYMSEVEFSIAYDKICKAYQLPRDYNEQEQQVDKLPFGIK